MRARPRIAWKLALLWGAALLVILLTVLDVIPGSAIISKAGGQTTASSTALDAAASAKRATARARASASAAAASTRGNALLATLNAATLSDDTAVAAVGAIDVTTGVEVAWQSDTFGQELPAYTASIVKLDIAEAYLLQAADTGAELDDQEQSLFVTMIENSNNTSASTLYDELGEDALETLNQRLGLTDTVLSDDGSWGLTQTSVDDELQLLSNLTSSDSPLSASARQYILGLMQNVESDQSWGVGDVGSNAAVKNGWLSLDVGDGWIINSVGVVTASNGDRVELVVLSNGWDTEADGIAAAADLAQNLMQAVGA